MLCIKPIDSWWDSENGLFENKFDTVKADINPFHNPQIYRFYTLRYNLLRQHIIYSHEYWNRFPSKLRLIAEVQADYYLKTLEYYTWAQRQYELNKYTNMKFDWKLMDKLDPNQWEHDLAHLQSLPDIETLYSDHLTYQIIPPRNKSRNSKTNESWHLNQGWVQDALHSSEFLAFKQFAHNRGGNILRKSTGSPLMLINDDIPLPTYATFLFWYNVLGHQYSNYINVPFPMKMFSFVIPHLPMTQEHRVHGSPQAAAIDWADSLSYRNTALQKDEHGNIKYGNWHTYITILTKDHIDTVTRYVFSAEAKIQHMAYQATQLSAYLVYPEHSIYNETMLSEVCTIGVADDTGKFESPESIHRGNVSKGMKMLARNYNLYMAFTDSKAEEKWVTAFNKAAFDWQTATVNKFNKSMMDELMILITTPPNTKAAKDSEDRLGVDIRSFFRG